MKIRISDLKAVARDSLRGHWFSAIIACFTAALFGAFCMSIAAWLRLFMMIALSIEFLEYIPDYWEYILIVASGLALFHFFVGETIRLGYIRFNLSLLDKENIKLRSLFGCFRVFWKAFYLRVFLFFVELCLSILFIIPGIYAYFTYAMAPYVLEERPAFPAIEAMRASRKMMQGNKFRLFRLKLSFIGWDFLCFITLGFACIYVVPYKNAAEAVFYNEISGRADVYYAREELS